MNLQCKSAIAAGALCLSLAAASSANATIIITEASAFQGEIVLIDGTPGVTTGPKIFGHTNQTNIGITYDGLGQTLEVQGSGQSFITGTDLNRLSYYITSGLLFFDTEFKISGATDTIDFTVIDDSGTPTVFSDVDLTQGSGFVGFQAIDGQLIKSVSFTVDDGGTFEEFRQLRLTPIPEPASWAMMLAGFGLVGAAMRRRRAITRVAIA